MAEHSRIAGNHSSARFEDLPKHIVRRQLNRSGNLLLAALEPLTQAEFQQGGASGISSAWVLGHLACVADLFGSVLDDGKLAFSLDTHEVFNGLDVGDAAPGPKAVRVDPNLYPKARILSMMRRSQIRLLKVLDVFDVRRWDDPAPDRLADTFQTCGAIWEHLAVHTYWHLGELSSAVERFHGTYTLNSMLHYFVWGENDTEAARRSLPPQSMIVPAAKTRAAS